MDGLPKNNKCILIVNNNEDIKLTLAEILRLQGYDVELASNGLEGLVKLKCNKYNTIITSILIPQMGGREFIKWSNIVMPQIPIIATSTFLTEGDAPPLFKLGAFKFISTPIDLNLCLDIIKLAILENERRKLNLGMK